MKPLGRILRMLKRMDNKVFELPPDKLSGIITPYGVEGEQAVITVLLHPDSSWSSRVACIMALGMERVIGSRATLEIRLALENMATIAPPEFAGFAFSLLMGSGGGRAETTAIYHKFANGEPWQREIVESVLAQLQYGLSLNVMRRVLTDKPNANPLEVLHALNHAGQIAR